MSRPSRSGGWLWPAMIVAGLAVLALGHRDGGPARPAAGSPHPPSVAAEGVPVLAWEGHRPEASSSAEPGLSTGRVSAADGTSVAVPSGWVSLPLDPTALDAVLAGLPGGRPAWSEAAAAQVRAAASAGVAAVAAEISTGTTLTLVRHPAPGESLEAVAARARGGLAAAGATDTHDEAVKLAAGAARRVAATVPVGGSGSDPSTRLIQYELVRGDDVVVLSFATADARMDPAVLDGVAASLQFAA